MYKLNEQQILNNWDTFQKVINKYITGERKEKLLNFYNRFSDDIIMYPASNKRAYHNAIPGGYIDHVLNVTRAALELKKTWEKLGVKKMDGFTEEELVFAALNHDLGKVGYGDEKGVFMYPSDDEWRKKNMGEYYKFNDTFSYMSVPDRTLFVLQKEGIPVTENEYIGIKVHDGLYDEANKKYFISFIPENKFRNPMPIILHHADMLATQLEFYREYENDF